MVEIHLTDKNAQLTKEDIKKIIPYDVPFLFIDRVLRLEKDFIIAEKFISAEEDFFKGHFVDFKIMPGALIIEGVGQTATLLIRSNITNHNEKDILAYKIKDTIFKAPVFPNSLIRYEVKLIMQDERFAIARGKVLCNENIVSECLMMIAIVSKHDFRGRYSQPQKFLSEKLL